MMRTRLATLIGTLVLAFPALGHHSQAEFGDDVFEMEGEIVAAYWRNPHVNFTLKTVDDDGNEQLWEMESASWNTLARRGMPINVFTAGDHVRVAVSRSTKRPQHLSVDNVLLDNGMEVVLGGGGQPRWSENYYGGMGMGATAATVPAAEPATTAGDLFRTWAIAGRSARTAGPRVTAHGLGARSASGLGSADGRPTTAMRTPWHATDDGQPLPDGV